MGAKPARALQVAPEAWRARRELIIAARNYTCDGGTLAAPCPDEPVRVECVARRKTLTRNYLTFCLACFERRKAAYGPRPARTPAAPAAQGELFR